ncbi:MAG: ABC transporter permease [Acidobacteriota bacterium]
MRTLQEFRYALRGIRKSPGFAAAILLSLGLAIGANTAIFSFFNAVLLRGMPFGDVDSLVRVRELRMETGQDPKPISVTGANYTAWKETNHSFQDLAVQVPSSFNLTGSGDPEQILGANVSANFLDVLGVKPILGRNIAPDEDRPGNPAPVVVLAHSLWQERFGGDPAIVGKTIVLDQQARTIIGVLPPRFKFPYRAEMWTPMGLDPADEALWRRRHLNVFGRLKDGVSLQQASTEMEGIAARLAQELPETNAGWSVQLTGLREDLVGDIRPRLIAVFAAAGFVLLIACANSANLLLARSLDQSNEVSIRVALGAGRARVARQFMMQSLVLSLLSGALGALLAVWTLPALVRLSPLQDMEAFFEDSVSVDPRALGFTLLISLLVGLLFGLIPAFNATRPNLQGLLKEGGRSNTGLRGQRWLRAFVVCEVAVSVILLAGAGLMLRSFQQLQGVDLGFDDKHLLVTEMSIPESTYPERPQQRIFYEQVLEKVKALPGVRTAGLTTNHPFTGEYRVAPFVMEDRPQSSEDEFFFTNHRVVTPGYFETLGIPLIKGRTFTPQDREDTPGVVVISKRFADTYWPGQDPLGKRVRVNRADTPWLTVIGVVGDVNDQGDYKETWYVPYTQDWRILDMNILVRTAGDPLALADPIRRAVWAVDRNQPVYGVASMETVAADVLRPQRFSTLLYGFFGGLALILALVGIYGVMSYAVSQRLREFGIRMALGAQSAQLKGAVMRGAMLLTAVGLVIGSVVAILLTRFIASLLYEVSPTDPVTFGAVLVVLVLVALAASYFPARKATKVDPVTALRYQ